MSITWKVLATWLLLVMLTASHSGFSWNTAVSCALTTSVLACVIYVSAASNWFLVWMIFVLYFGISWVKTLFEALVFHVLPPLIAFQSGTLGLTTAFTISVALCFLMGRMRLPDKPLWPQPRKVWFGKLPQEPAFTLFSTLSPA